MAIHSEDPEQKENKSSESGRKVGSSERQAEDVAPESQAEHTDTSRLKYMYGSQEKIQRSTEENKSEVLVAPNETESPLARLESEHSEMVDGHPKTRARTEVKLKPLRLWIDCQMAGCYWASAWVGMRKNSPMLTRTRGTNASA